eukprot:RCo055757
MASSAPRHTSLLVLSDSPRSRRMAIRIQAAFRGHLCRKRFSKSLLANFVEELEEAEEWGRADLESMERVDLTELKECFRAFQTINVSMRKPSRADSIPMKASPSLKEMVLNFCANIEKLLVEVLDNDACRELLPDRLQKPVGLHGMEGCGEADCFGRLFSTFDCLQHVLFGVSTVLKGVVSSADPLAPYQDLRHDKEELQRVNDSLRDRAVEVETQLAHLSMHLAESQAAASINLRHCLDKEKHIRDEIGFLQGLLDVPGLSQPSRSRGGSRPHSLLSPRPSSRPPSATTTPTATPTTAPLPSRGCKEDPLLPHPVPEKVPEKKARSPPCGKRSGSLLAAVASAAAANTSPGGSPTPSPSGGKEAAGAWPGVGGTGSGSPSAREALSRCQLWTSGELRSERGRVG